MKLKGTIIGFILGWVFLNPFSAVIGALLGYFLHDKPRMEKSERYARTYNKFTRDANYNQTLVDITFSFMGYIARGAGRINEDHIKKANQIMDQMQLNSSSRKIARDAFNLGKQDGFDIDEKVRLLRDLAGDDNVCFVDYLLEIQIQVALSDGHLEKDEQDRLMTLATHLGVPLESIQRLIATRYNEMLFEQQFYRQYQSRGAYDYGSNDSESYEQSYSSAQRSSSSGLDAAYKLLGVTEESSEADIKKAHKKLMLKYHPDRLASQGLSDEMIRMYTEKAKDIQSAFDLIRKSRGFK
ncbi:MAG: co-chaperone DjlA [Succinivibrio sp.]